MCDSWRRRVWAIVWAADSNYKAKAVPNAQPEQPLCRVCSGEDRARAGPRPHSFATPC